MRSALILTGGNATRAGGLPKYDFSFGGRSFLERQIEILRSCTDEICIICRNKDQERLFHTIPDVRITHDKIPGQGPAGGIQAGSCAVSGEYFFVTACDMPFLSCDVINYLFERAEGYDAAVPLWEDGKIEPLCAVFKRESVNAFFEGQMERRLTRFIGQLHTRYIPVEEIQRLDPELNVFQNINDFKTFSKIEKINSD